MKKIERLSELAARRADPVPLDAGGVMARLRSLEIEDDDVMSLPIGFFAGGVAAAAAAAVAVSVIAATAWTEMSVPEISAESLINVMDFIS